MAPSSSASLELGLHEVDQHPVEQAADLDHRHVARGGGVGVVLGGRGAGRATPAAEEQEQGAATSAAWIASGASVRRSSRPGRSRSGRLSVDPARFFGASRLVIVAGKGGVGKTTVSAALARAAARTGLSSLVIEVEGKSGLPTMFGQGALDYEEVILSAGGGPAAEGEVRARTLTPDEALLEYLQDHGLSRISRRLVSSGALDVVATAAPGIKDILILGKVKPLERAADADLIVLDAPAAGHAITFLQAARGLLDTVPVGPINAQARDVLEMLTDHERCQVVLVTLPEETPVNELVDTAFHLEDRVGVGLGPVVVNGCYDELVGIGADPVAAAEAAGRHAARRARPRRWPRPPRSGPTGPRSRPSSWPAWPTSSRCRSCASRSCSPPRSGPPSSTGSPTALLAEIDRAPGGRVSDRPDAARTSSTSAGSSCAAGPAASARPPPRPRWRSRRRGPVGAPWSSPSTRPSGSPTRSGLDGLTGTPAKIDGDWPGELWALMLDTKSTFDELVVGNAVRPGAGRAHPAEPLLPEHLRGPVGHPGVHGDGEALRAAPERPTSTSSWSTRRRRATPSTSSTPRVGCPGSSTTASSAWSPRPAGGS